MIKTCSFIQRFVLFLVFVPLLNSCDTLGTGTSGLSEAEVAQGLKAALQLGADTAATRLHITDGYFKDEAIKIFLPAEAAPGLAILSNTIIGQSLIDNVVLKLNRAAEDAAIEAKPIFVNAITNMSVMDAFSILHGKDTAATHYLRQNTYSGLYTAYEPKINASLSRVGAQQSWDQLFSRYNLLPGVPRINPSLSAHCTNRALSGLFVKVAIKEKDIRKNPLARISEILRKVFAELDK